jgi:hypothetical protein
MANDGADRAMTGTWTPAGTAQAFRCVVAALAVMVSTGFANEALDLLEAEPGSGIGTVMTTGPDPAVERKAEQMIAPPDPTLRRRWDPELSPQFQIRLTDAEAIISDVAFRGLFEWRLASGDIEFGDGTGMEVDSSRFRRARLGLALLAYYDTELLVEGMFDGEGAWRGIESLKARIPLGERTALSLGKFPPPFTLEYARDAAVRWFPELSPLVAQIAPADSLGALLEAQGASWDWKLGWFSGDADRDTPSFDGNGYVLAGLGYTFNGGSGEGGTGYRRWHLDYIHNFDAALSESIPLGYRNMVATGFQMSSGRFDVMADLMLAKGAAGSVWGASVGGGYWLLEDAVRLVARFDYATSNTDGGVLAGWGIPRSGGDVMQPFGYPAVWAGDELRSLYSGLNIHLYEDNLILNSGLEYRSMSGVLGGPSETLDALIWQAGGRLAF